jgi:hypothetical protein
MSTISKTGSVGKPTRGDKNKIISNLSSKISLINKYLETKVNKAGDVMTGNLNMNNNHIINVKDPEADGDVVTKRYCEERISSACEILKKDIISQVEHDRSKIRHSSMLLNHGDSMKGTLDMGSHRITGVNYPDSALDAINKKYLQIAYLNNAGTINTKKLMSICYFVNELLVNHSEDFTSAFDRQFRLKYTWMQKMILRYNRLYRRPDLDTVLETWKPDLQSIVEAILFPYIKDMMCLLIAIIEDLPKNIFDLLKAYLLHDKILKTPDEGTDLMKIRKFLNKFTKDLDSNRKNENFNLLLQKNLMFVDLGFIYISDSLLAQFGN